MHIYSEWATYGFLHYAGDLGYAGGNVHIHIHTYMHVYSEWATDGFLHHAGDLDYAGGNVVHICSGCSGLAASLIGVYLCV